MEQCANPHRVCLEHASAQARGRWVVKGIHTLIFLLLTAGVLETIRAGLQGKSLCMSGPAIVATSGEELVLASYDNRCPLTGLAEELGSEHRQVSDIFLPRWFARHIPSIFTTLFGFGLGRLIESKSRVRT